MEQLVLREVYKGDLNEYTIVEVYEYFDKIEYILKMFNPVTLNRVTVEVYEWRDSEATIDVIIDIDGVNAYLSGAEAILFMKENSNAMSTLYEDIDSATALSDVIEKINYMIENTIKEIIVLQKE